MDGRRFFIAAAVVLALVAAGVAYATIPDSNGIIHACYEKQSGHARIFDSESGTPKPCGKTEAEIAWNQQGVKGDKGDPGPQGPQGPQGEPGPPGLSGYEIVSANATFKGNGTTSGVGIGCDPGKVVLGGGWRSTSAGSQPLIVVEDSPDGLTGWKVLINNDNTFDIDGFVYAICANVTF